jgi:hypothetical protein
MMSIDRTDHRKENDDRDQRREGAQTEEYEEQNRIESQGRSSPFAE